MITNYCFFFKNDLPLPSSKKYTSVLNQQIISPSSFSPNLLFDAILYVANVTKSDHGIYECRADNLLGIDTHKINLTGLSKSSDYRSFRCFLL